MGMRRGMVLFWFCLVSFAAGVTLANGAPQLLVVRAPHATVYVLGGWTGGRHFGQAISGRAIRREIVGAGVALGKWALL